MGVFNANDIRGIFDEEWDLETAYRIGYFLPEILDTGIIAAGRDARLSSGEIFDHLCRGINDAGADVIDIGLCDTPAMYFTVGMYGYGGGVMITASHNPPEYNGIKIVRKGPSAIGYSDGISLLEKKVNESLGVELEKKKKGGIVFKNIEKDYLDFYSGYTKNIGNLKIVVDCSNGTAGVYGRKILTGTNVNAVYLNEKPDGHFPGHGPDPMKRENLAQLSFAVKNEKADIGLCFDGDADRVVFIDEKGTSVSPDMIIAILGKYFLKNGKETILYDLRCSNGIAEFISECGGDAVMCPVGHVFLKKNLKETGSAFGGELAG
ncbi:MAG: phosphomannomutase/phosphoglucomutase, partial [Spirochaetia bacterium]|nr:phosphomannomutase/phosphoglucomutase [Spirochaetia bacterium]